MNIDEIREEKNKLEQRLLILIQEFENKTDCRVNSVCTDKIDWNDGKEKTTRARAEITIYPCRNP